MGVDYSANFGVGVRVIIPEDIEDKEGYMEDVLKGSVYKWFQEGDEDYGGDPNWYYACLKTPFKDSYNIETEVQELYLYLYNKGVEYAGKADVVGGLRIH